MANRKTRRQQEEESVLTHKQLARRRVEQKHRRRVLLAVAALVGVVTLILAVAIVNEYVIKPGQPVAVVNDTEIRTVDYQERVRMERAQMIELIEQYAEIFGVEQVYGLAGQVQEYEAFGEQVLDSMIEEVLIRDATAEMGLTVAEDEVWQTIEEREGYYRGGTPTPRPTATPWPTATPITSTETIASPTPVRTPYPSPTAVTKDMFDDLYAEQTKNLKKFGVDEATYRGVVEFQLLTEKVREWLMQDVPAEADQVQFDVMIFDTLEAATGILARLEDDELFEALMSEAQMDAEDGVTTSAVPWTPYDDLAAQLGEQVAQMAFSLEVDTYSQVIGTSDDRFVLINVTGHEERELSASTKQSKEDALYTEWLDGLKAAASIEKMDYVAARTPRNPALDLTKLQPTATPGS